MGFHVVLSCCRKELKLARFFVAPHTMRSFGSKKFACCQFVTWSFPISAAKWLSAQNMAILWGRSSPPILWGADFLDKQLLVVQTILRSAHRCTLWPTYFYLLPTDSLFKPPSSISICMHRCSAGVNGWKIYKDFLFFAQQIIIHPNTHWRLFTITRSANVKKSHQSFVLVSVVKAHEIEPFSFVFSWFFGLLPFPLGTGVEGGRRSSGGMGHPGPQLPHLPWPPTWCPASRCSIWETKR